ncbi:MAG: hypothetical protein QWI73_04840 [Alphaproteobacteria bacterium]|nr:hypothetical protein [Alphaproteobacteria bacterium]
MQGDIEKHLWKRVLRLSSIDDDYAAKEQLAAGFPIYYIEDNIPENTIIKEYPNGNRELLNNDGVVIEINF